MTEQASTDQSTDERDDHDEREEQTDEGDRADAAEEFAREHDPAEHDVSAGEQFRQRGDWTAEDADGPQVWDAEGNLVSEASADGGQEAAEGGSAGPRTSRLEEVRDGGYGVGSAAPIGDGAVPLGHPVKAWEDTKTYVMPGEAGYGDAQPDLWFVDDMAARRAGFRAGS